MDHINQYINELQDVLDNLPVDVIDRVISTLHDARLTGKQIFMMGNGGSASTASHFVCDLGKNTKKDGWPPFRVIGLVDNLASISAYANDEGFENIFANQLANLVHPGDVVIGISTSGNSANIINAVETANKLGAKTIGFTGFNGGELSHLVDINLCVPCNNIEQIEDVHLMLEHLICKTLREKTQQALLPQELIKAFDNELTINLDLHNLLRQILRLTLGGIGASSGSIMVLNKKGDVIEGALAYGGNIYALNAQQFVEIIERGLAGWVYENRQATLVTNTRNDPRWLPRTWDRDNGNARSAISVPLMSNDQVVGVLTLVHSTADRFTKDDLMLLTAITVCMSLANYAV